MMLIFTLAFIGQVHKVNFRDTGVRVSPNDHFFFTVAADNLPPLE